MIYFVNPIKNPNVGDVAIFYASSMLFRSLGLDYTIINQTNYATCNPGPHDFLVICGGGWLGIYDDSLIDFFLYMIQTYSKKCRVVLMPSSFAPIKQSFARIANCEFTAFARDRDSYNNYVKFFPHAHVEFCHDMAFSLFRLNARKPFSNLSKHEIGIYDRNDAESVSIIKTLHEYGMQESRLNKFVNCDKNIKMAFKYICEQEYRMLRYKLIVTDTLHMSIFAFLLNLPCLYLDNSYKKLYHTWSEYGDCSVRQYDPAIGLSIGKYSFFENSHIKFDYTNLIQTFTRT